MASESAKSQIRNSAQQRRPAERGDRADRAEQQRRPLLGEQDDDVEVPLLLAAPGAVLARASSAGPRRCRPRARRGSVRKTVNRTVKTSAKAASAHAHASHPTRRDGAHQRRVAEARGGATWSASAAMKNVPATNTVMNVDSLVAKLSASSAPISAGWWRRGRSRKRNVTASSAQRDAGDVDVLAREAAVVEVGRPERERDGGAERADPPELAAQQVGERAPSACPSAPARAGR